MPYVMVTNFCKFVSFAAGFAPLTPNETTVLLVIVGWLFVVDVAVGGIIVGHVIVGVCRRCCCHMNFVHAYVVVLIFRFHGSVLQILTFCKTNRS